MRPACCHSRRLSESRMRENLTYGLMRGRWRRAVGLLDRDTRLKGEKRPGVAGPATVPRHCSTLQLRNLERKAPKHARAEIREDFHRIVYAASADAARGAYAAFERAWGKRCPAVVTSLREGG